MNRAKKKAVKSQRRPSRRTGLDLQSNLSAIEQAQLVRRADDQDLSYFFKHALTQETAYQSLLLKTRRGIHRAVASSIEELYPGRLDEYAALLAQHFAEAGEDAKTLEYAARAGDAAARVYANHEAVTNYSLALEVARRTAGSHPVSADKGKTDKPGVSWLRLYTGRGRALELSGRHEEALENYSEMETFGRSRGDRPLELAALIARATLLSIASVVRDVDRAQVLCDRALALAREIGDRQSEARILWSLMLVNTFGKQNAHLGAKFGEQSLSLAREFNLREQQAFTLNDLTYAYIQGGRLDRAAAVQAEASGLWRELDNRPMLADNLGIAAVIQHLLGNSIQAVALCHEAVAINQAIGNAWGESTGHMQAGFCSAPLGEFGQAIRENTLAVELGEKMGAVGPALCARCGLAEWYAGLGAFERGIEAAYPALSYSEANFPVWVTWTRAALARIYILQGNLEQAEAVLGGVRPATFKHNLSIYLPTGAVIVTQAHIELALARQDFETAENRLDEFLAYLKQIGARTYIPQVEYLQAQALLGQLKSSQAYEILNEARELGEELGHPPSLWPILGRLAEIEAERGESDRARAIYARARETVLYIADRAGEPDLHRCFLALPAVRRILEGI